VAASSKNPKEGEKRPVHRLPAQKGKKERHRRAISTEKGGRHLKNTTVNQIMTRRGGIGVLARETPQAGRSRVSPYEEGRRRPFRHRAER